MTNEIDGLIQEAGDSLFAPEKLEDIRCRLSFVAASECNCDETPHENALHDLAHDDVPVLLSVIDRLTRPAITTVEELDALPLNTVVVDAVGIPRTKRHGNSHMSGGWTHAGNSPLTSRELADGRAMTVVWHPEWSA